MALNATNFVVKGPIKSADMLQFVNLFTGVMTDQPITFRNAVTVGGNQGTNTAPLSLYGSAGQTSNLLNLYPSTSSANPTWGIAALGQHSWGAGSPVVLDTYLSRIATQNGHATDTAGLLVSPYLEVAGNITATTYMFPNSATLTGPTANPFFLVANQSLAVGNVNERLRFQNNIFAMESTDYSTAVWANGNVGLNSNLHFDGTNWVHYDTTRPSVSWGLDPAQGVFMDYAAAGSGATAAQRRFTIDTSGNLNVYGTITAAGTIYANANASVVLPNGGSIVGVGPDSTQRAMMMNNGGEVLFWANQSNQFRWVNNGNSVEWMRLTASGLVVGVGNSSVGANFTVGNALTVGQNAIINGGILYLSTGSIFLSWDGTHINSNQPLSSSSYIVANTSLSTNSGVVYLRSDNAVLVGWSGFGGPANNIYLNQSTTVAAGFAVNYARGANAGGIMFYTSAGTGHDVNIFAENGAMYFWAQQPTGVVYNFNMNVNNAWATLFAASYTVQSQRKAKRDIALLEDPLSFVLDEDLHGVRYVDRHSGERMLGFIADDWLARAPELVRMNEDGEVFGFDYNRASAITFEALKQYVTRTDRRIAELEAQLERMAA